MQLLEGLGERRERALTTSKVADILLLRLPEHLSKPARRSEGEAMGGRPGRVCRNSWRSAAFRR